MEKTINILADIHVCLRSFDFLYNFLNLLNVTKLNNKKLLCFVVSNVKKAFQNANHLSLFGFVEIKIKIL